MSREITGLGLGCCLVRGGRYVKAKKWSLRSQTIDPDVMIGFLELVKMWSIREGYLFVENPCSLVKCLNKSIFKSCFDELY